MPQNVLCWVDIPVTDLGRAQKFYAAVLAKPVELQKHEDMEFAVLPHANEQASGCLVASDKNKPSETGPLIYLSVEGRLNAAAKAVESSGGKILEPKIPIGPFGFRVTIRDTEGNRIALHSFQDS